MFSIKVGVYQNSVFSALFVVKVVDAVTCGVPNDPPWNLLHAGDIFLAATTRQELEDNVFSKI